MASSSAVRAKTLDSFASMGTDFRSFFSTSECRAPRALDLPFRGEAPYQRTTLSAEDKIRCGMGTPPAAWTGKLAQLRAFEWD